MDFETILNNTDIARVQEYMSKNNLTFDAIKTLLNSTNFTYSTVMNQTNDTDSDYPEVDPNTYITQMTSLKVFFYCVYVLIFVLGIAGNALVCYVVFRNTTMHTVTNMFITNLALSDILLCAFAVPFTPLYLLTYKEWVFGSFFCHLVPFAQGKPNHIFYHVYLFACDLVNNLSID